MTALFADTVGSTWLGERLTPDEVKGLIGECVSRMSRAVEEFGGTIQAYTGDGICAYFGIPVAHEDDAERAARAGLRILEVIEDYSQDIRAAWAIEQFNVRVGINSGQTGVGLVGGTNPQEVALGDTTNIAARLEGTAAPGTIAVGEETAARIERGFALEPLGEIPVKGRERPVPAWRLVGVRSKSEGAPSIPLVGRERELEVLSGVLTGLQDGRGQILLLSGEAGRGKSRLISELRPALGEDATWLGGRCLPYGGQLAGRPFAEAVRGWLGVTEWEPEVATRLKLRAKLAGLMGERLPDVLPHIGRLLSVGHDADMDSPLETPTPQEMSARLEVALRLFLEQLAANGPVVLVLEDMEWADPSARGLAERLLEVTDRAPLLVVAAFRAEPGSQAAHFRFGALANYPHRVTEIALGPLSEKASLRLARALVPPGRRLDDAAEKDVVARAEGNPLYLEELVRAVLDTSQAGPATTWSFTIPGTRALPPALENLLMARIDRLPAGARKLVQLAAVVGRAFPVRVLEHLTEEGGDVSRDLPVLLRADLILETSRFPELVCSFRHGLVQEAALSTLPKPRLREAYGRVGLAFEELFADSLNEYLDALAFYFYRSDERDKALDYLERAGVQAAELHATAQARTLWNRARRLALQLGDGQAERRISDRVAGLPV